MALYFKINLDENNLSTAEILDLKEYNIPIFTDKIKNPSEKVIDFAARI